MKKIFPVIITLISLSLMGIIYIQFNWIQNMAVIRKEQLDDKITMVMDEVGQDLVNQRSSAINNSTTVPGLRMQSEIYDFKGQYSVAKRFTDFEVREKLQNAFKNKGLKDTHFEFAITANSLFGRYEMKSEGFIKLAEDTLHNQRYAYSLVPSSGSLLEGLAPEEVLWVVVPDVKSFVFKSLGWMISGAILFTLILITAFYLTVTTMLKQKKLSEIKSDFINNMTHEFKTPLATISLAVDALKNEKVKQDAGKMEYFSGIIKEENKRMNKQVETILQAAQLDKEEIQLNLKPLHIHEIIQRSMDNLRLQVQDKGGTMEASLNATDDLMQADEVHMTNLISNLLDNAVKYSKENLAIKISTKNVGKNIRVTIEDNGIGMSKETVKRIFEKFYRAHTGNLHNVKGFGLGLSYVKTMVEAHEGTIKADSTLGKGSTFTIDLPLSK
ncbi:MAG: HAMP domain-containing histidine kinase [Sphingobacteriales bacterium]|nr:HAMP domain-containing histidine kinase [Sphingobacteriales bacterium]MBI3718221.1 HAMP domain-containing histidine kinase [Sphingobacteriales bacterium]